MLDVFLQMRRQRLELCNFLQITCGKIRKDSQYNGRRCMSVSHQSKPNIVLARPSRVLGYCDHNPLGYVGLCEYLQDLALCKKAIVECKFDCLRMSFRQNRARNSRRPASRQRQFLSDWQIRNPRENNSLSRPSNICRGGGLQAYS